MDNNSGNIKPHLNNTGVSYLLWLGCAFGVAGLHRFYNRKIFTGLFWLCTWGFFGIGQFIDLFLIPEMVDEHNWRMYRKFGVSSGGLPQGHQLPQLTLTENKSPNLDTLSQDQLMVILAKAAHKKQGKLSLTEAVIETDISFTKAEVALEEMVKRGYISVENHPETGVVIYNFADLS
ncbi:TM2 domain-containing protein [Gloeocapsa sp. PCC 73106]|uniref:TM2 domain-containing protein n=1 Tax=Gloeocapsa sp. PCC 73106 TaxID=102232 RepID=UPI0002AC7BD0|nr:NINE protein [Gloeocapsa sp. PCC 73106]ELR96332.1 putative membrane protein [Gloeocapsa sp. PCC 73106]